LKVVLFPQLIIMLPK